MTYRFSNHDASHKHSLETLNLLYEHDDFMESIENLADMGAGHGLDTEWWATRTTRDEAPRPLNIKCMAVDQFDQFPMAQKHRYVSYLKQDFEQPIMVHKRKFDVVWCHDAFQYVIDPFKTLASWYDVMSPNGMLVIILPQSTNLEFNIQAFDQHDHCYWNWSLVSLIHVLAVSGFDCAGGFFKKSVDDPWLHAAVYKSAHAPRDPRTTSWLDLANSGLLPETAVKSFDRYGHVRQRDLVLPWLDHNLIWYGKH